MTDPTTETRSSSSAVASDYESNASTDLPFLITHWLANYNANTEDPDKKQALEQMKKATSQLASAFSTLGAFGTTIRVSEIEMFNDT